MAGRPSPRRGTSPARAPHRRLAAGGARQITFSSRKAGYTPPPQTGEEAKRVKIYTKTGDDGTTGLFGGARVKKASSRVEAYGTVDEVNATIGIARATKLDPFAD